MCTSLARTPAYFLRDERYLYFNSREGGGVGNHRLQFFDFMEVLVFQTDRWLSKKASFAWVRHLVFCLSVCVLCLFRASAALAGNIVFCVCFVFNLCSFVFVCVCILPFTFISRRIKPNSRTFICIWPMRILIQDSKQQ